MCNENYSSFWVHLEKKLIGNFDTFTPMTIKFGVFGNKLIFVHAKDNMRKPEDLIKKTDVMVLFIKEWMNIKWGSTS